VDFHTLITLPKKPTHSYRSTTLKKENPRNKIAKATLIELYKVYIQKILRFHDLEKKKKNSSSPY
jgi:hypothetical protein